MAQPDKDASSKFGSIADNANGWSALEWTERWNVEGLDVFSRKTPDTVRWQEGKVVDLATERRHRRKLPTLGNLFRKIA